MHAHHLHPAKIVDAGIPRQGGQGHEVFLWAAAVIILISYLYFWIVSIYPIVVYAFDFCLFFVVVVAVVVVEYVDCGAGGSGKGFDRHLSATYQLRLHSYVLIVIFL